MFKFLYASLLVSFFLGCTSTRQIAKLPENDNLTYTNKENHVILTLPHIKGWTAGVPSDGLARNIVYGAVHVGKIMNLVLSVEPLNADLEDYYILVKRANDFEKRSGFKRMVLDTFTLNGAKALRFVYQADVITIDSSLLYEEDSTLQDSVTDSSAESDSLTEPPSPYVFTPYIYTNIFTSYNEFNHWLEISTLAEGYDRRKPFIEEIINGLKITK